MEKREKGDMNERSDGNEMCVRNHKTSNEISSLQKHWRRSLQMKDGSGGLIVNTFGQVGCRVVDSLIEGMVEHCSL